MKKNSFSRRILSVILAMVMCFGIIQTGIPAAQANEQTDNVGTTTFVYVGSNESITGANLCFYVTWGTATYNANAEDCGITVTPDGNSVTLQVDKANLTDTTVWMNMWDNVVWTNWEGVSCTFSGETYYVYDDSVSTTPPAEPDVPETTEPETTEPAIDYGTSTFVYVGSNESITGANLCFYVTWGTKTYEANAENCGITVIPNGNSVTLQIDKAEITSSPVWMNIWDDVVWTNWNGVSCTFSGDTYYIYDDSVSITPPADPDVPETTEPETTEPETTEPETTEPETTELETTEPETTEPETTEPETTEPETTEPETTEPETTEPETTEPEATDPQPTDPGTNYGTSTFVYVGSNESITGANLCFYVTWGTKTYEANAENCGITVIPNGNSVTLQIDKAEITSSPVWMNIWDDVVYTNWGGVSCTFSGDTYYIYDDKVSTVSPEAPAEPTEPNQEYSITIHCYGEGYQVGAWLALVENGTEVSWTSEADSRTAAFGDLQDGWTSVTLSWSLKETYNRLGFSIGADDPWTGTRYIYDLPAATGTEVWIVPGYEGVYSSAEKALANTWKYYYDFTIHCYGQGYRVGAWLTKVSDGKEVGWLDSESNIVRTFRNLKDGWTSTLISWGIQETYNRLSFKIGQNSPWESKTYSHDFAERIEEIWIIPGDPTVYLSEEAALAALNDPASAEYSFLVHYYGENCKIGAWLARVEDMTEVAWTAEEETELRDFQAAGDGWSQAWVRWNTETVYNRLGFAIAQEDPWTGQRYCYDFTESPAEIWVIPDDTTVYTSREAAEAAMMPAVEEPDPVETEPPAETPTEAPTETLPQAQTSADGPDYLLILCIGIAVIVILLLVLFLRKRKK